MEVLLSLPSMSSITSGRLHWTAAANKGEAPFKMQVDVLEFLAALT